jgi:SAM-dependent methyltransferase
MIMNRSLFRYSPTVVEVASSVLSSRCVSAAGHAEAPDALVAQYESVPFERAHAGITNYLVVPPCRVAVIGAGTGRDAAALAARGHEVVAVESVPELRPAGEGAHAEAALTWTDDTLPELARLDGEFGLVLMTALLTNLDDEERDRVLKRVVSLLAPGGRWVLTLRHGPAEHERQVFDVNPGDLIFDAAGLGLELAHFSYRDDPHGHADVTWTSIVMDAPSPGSEPFQSATALPEDPEPLA